MDAVKDRTAKNEMLEDEFRKSVDAIPLSPQLQQLRDRYFNEEPKVSSERVKLVLQALKETDGDPIELQRAKVLRTILEGITIAIHDGETTAGNQTEFFRGSWPYVDWDSEYLKDVMLDAERVTFGSPALDGAGSAKDFEIFAEATSYFKGKTPAERSREALRAVWDSWYDDAVEARACVPPIDRYPYLPGVALWEKVLEKGLRGVIQEAEAAVQRSAKTDGHDIEKIYFWQAVILSCEAVISFARRHAQLAGEMAARERNPERREELDEMARTCAWVPENPARTFHEAIQSLRLVNVPLLLENGRTATDFGRIDQYLYPFFERDIKEGRLTLEKAADLIGELITYLARLEQIVERRTGETLQSTMVNHITIGGVTRDGQDASNDLTYLTLHVLGLLGYAEPHATLRLHSGTPHCILLKSHETNRKVNGIPMYVNDTHVINYLAERSGMLEEARDWSMYGCSEPVASPQRHFKALLLNAACVLDVALHNGIAPSTGKRIGVETGDPRNFTTFEEVEQAFKRQLQFIYRRFLKAERLMHQVQVETFRLPLRSALDYGCIERGMSHLIGGNGAYPGSYHIDRGLIDVADSLTSIKRLVFDEKKLTMEELVETLDSNFEGRKGEEIRQMCLAAPKYGNDIDEADCAVRDVAKFSADVICSEKNMFGKPYILNRNGVSWHYSGGKGVGALPNGRKAWKPLYDGSLSPMTGKDMYGPTAVLNSAIKADYRDVSVPIINLKFPLTVLQSPEGLEKVSMLTETFIKNGGIHIQYNFLDKQTLLAAKKDPEEYKDLVVRVAGYSAYFVNLTSEVQDEIIARTEHCL